MIYKKFIKHKNNLLRTFQNILKYDVASHNLTDSAYLKFKQI